jgi:hypothetical protein
VSRALERFVQQITLFSRTCFHLPIVAEQQQCDLDGDPSLLTNYAER